jgi:hypothetical protein
MPKSLVKEISFAKTFDFGRPDFLLSLDQVIIHLNFFLFDIILLKKVGI